MAARLITYYLALLLVVAPARAAQPRWPCPEFGECRAQAVFGACALVVHFEFSRRLQQRGNAALWEPDEPKPCSIAVRVGKDLERYTYELYRCKEIEQLLEDLQGRDVGQAQMDRELFGCDGNRDGGRVTLVHPDQSFYHGEWKSLVREAVLIPGAEDCQVKKDDRILECKQLQGAQRLWVQDLLVAARWRLRAAASAQLPQQPRFELAPGDRMRED